MSDRDVVVTVDNVQLQVVHDGVFYYLNVPESSIAAQDAELAGLDEAGQLAQIEADEKAKYENKRTQAQQTDKALQDLITQAGQALAGGNLSLAAT